MNCKANTDEKTAIQKLLTISKEINELNNIEALLHWDQEVCMPSGAAGERANQLATISRVIHQKETSPVIDDLLKESEQSLYKLSEKDRALVRVMRRNYNQKTKLPEEFVAKFSKLTSQALQCWIDARKKSDFKQFQPFLEKIIDMTLQKAEYLGYTDHPYDALLDLYEEDLKADEVAEVFETIKTPLITILDKCRQRKIHKFSFEEPFDEDKQSEFSKSILRKMGYDFNRGREDKSPHPFTTSLGHNDRRVTNRFQPDSVDFIFSAFHEGGHALYEQGINKSIAGSHLDTGISLGIHESQSRLWENMIGRSLAFWRHFYPELQKAFPDHFNAMSVDQFVACINQVKPGFIRVDADEVSYNFHVLIRFELEKALLEKTITSDDLPALWNRKYKEYFGLEVPDDAAGVLQDIHWSHGSIGYFPTYTLGNLYSAQIWHTYQQVNLDYQSILENGDLAMIREWLCENIYRYGAIYPPKELLKRVTGRDLSAEYLINYLQQKYCT